MEHKITLYGNKKYIALETVSINKNKIINRKEIDNENNIQEALSLLIPGIKNINKKESGIMEINLPENAQLTILNYDNIKHYEALSELTECIKEIEYSKKWKKRMKTCATVLGLSTTAIATISSFQKDNETTLLPITITAEAITNQNLEDEITILNRDNLLYASPKEMENDVILESQIEPKFDFNLQNFFPEIGSKKDDPRKQNVENEYGDLTEKYSLITGIDQELIECLLSQERGFHSSEKDKGGAIGVAQIQVNHHEGEKLYLRNEITGKTESFIVTKELIKDLEGNIKTCATLLQNKLDYYDGNTLIFLQSYNFGYGAMDKVLEDTSNALNQTIDEIVGNPTNLEWLNLVEAYSNSKSGYGDPNYCQNVLSFYNEDEFTIKYNKDGENVKIPINILENEKSHGL